MSLLLTDRYASFLARPLRAVRMYRWQSVLLLSGLSALIYGWGLIAPYNVEALELRPLISIAKLTRNQPGTQAAFVLTFAALSAVYYLTWRLARGVQPRAVWLANIAGLALVNLGLLALYPIGAADIFDNIIRGRLLAVHGGNPFYETPRAYVADPFFAYTGWRDATSAYGPAWEALAVIAARLAGDGVLANLLAFKLLGLVFYGGCLVLIARLLQKHAPERALQGMVLLAWNPLVIYETAGNGHNDIVMVFFVLLGLYALSESRFTLAALALTLGALIKFIPILLLPIVLAHALRALDDRPPGSTGGWRRRVTFSVVTVFACAALVVAAYAPFWRGGDPLALMERGKLFTTSLPALIQAQLETQMGREASQWWVSRAALLFVGISVVGATWRAWRETGWLAPVRLSALVLTAYLMFACLWFQPWYTIWPLALAALLPEGALARLIVLLSYAALWKTIVFDFFLYRGAKLPPRLVREMWLGPATLIIPWMYALYAGARRVATAIRSRTR